jgi:hypothetical protein
MTFKEKIIMEVTLNKLLGDDWEIVKIEDVEVFDKDGNLIITIDEWKFKEED